MTEMKQEICSICLAEFEASNNDIFPSENWGNVYVCPQCVRRWGETGSPYAEEDR